MSITPYNRFTVKDLSEVQQPYVNSTAEYGYFNGISVGTIPINNWRSLPAVLNTNNGIASLDASGVRILNAGIYSINISVFPTSTKDGSSNISFNFGTTYLFDVSTSQIADAFGGERPTGMFTFTYDPFINTFKPGIITWVANGYSSGNSTTNNFIKNSTTNELSYNYFNAGYPTTNALYSGNCTTEMTFIVDSPATIFFNVSTNSDTGVTMGNCFFTLELISTYSFPPIIGWTQRNASLASGSKCITSSASGEQLFVGGPSTIRRSLNYGVTWTAVSGLPSGASWTSIASSSDGTKLAAVTNDTGVASGIYTSINSGANWSQSNASVGEWNSIASSSDLTRLAAVLGGFSGATRGIYVSIDSGVNWSKTAAVAVNWKSIASSSDGTRLAALASTTLYTSSNSGGAWTERGTINGLPAEANWTSIASSSTGQYLAAVADTIGSGANGIYTSSNFGANWQRQTNGVPPNANWQSIASSSTGQYLAVVSNLIYTSNNFGGNWRLQNKLLPTSVMPTSLNFESIASSSDGTRLALVSFDAGMYTTEPT